MQLRGPLAAGALVVCLALLLGAAPVMAEDAGADTTYAHRLEQGRFFLGQERPEAALEELEAARDTPTGQTSFEVHHLLSGVYWELLRVGDAVASVRRASALAEGEIESALVRGLFDYLTRQLALCTVVLEGEGPAELSPDFPVLDPKLRAMLEQLDARLEGREGTILRGIYLPVGTWSVGGSSVEIVPGVTNWLFPSFP